MHYDYVVLNAGRELALLERVGQHVGNSVQIFTIPMMKYLSEMALDLDNRRARLLTAVAAVGEILPSDKFPDEARAGLQMVVGDVAMNLFNSVDDLLGTHNLLPAPGTRHLLSDYKFHGLCAHGVIMAREIVQPQSY